MVLARRHVDYLVKFAKSNRRIVWFFKRTSIPDETFMHTVLMNSEYAHEVTNDSSHFFRFGEYDGRRYVETTHPAVLSEEDLPDLASSDAQSQISPTFATRPPF